MAGKYPSIPNPTRDPANLQDVCTLLKQTVETVTNQRGDPGNSMVSWNDLVRLGLITPNAVPRRGQ